MNYKDRCKYLEERIRQLNEIGIALSKEDDFNKLFEMIMEEARHITNADGRTLYMSSKDGKSLEFEIIRPFTLFASDIKAISLNCSSSRSGDILIKIGLLFKC